MQGQLQQKQTTYTHRPTRPVKCRDSYNRNKQHIHTDQHGPSNAGTATTETNNIYTKTNTARQMQGQLQQTQTTYTHRPTRPVKCRDSYNRNKQHIHRLTPPVKCRDSYNRHKQHIHTDQHSPSNAGTATTETNIKCHNDNSQASKTHRTFHILHTTYQIQFSQKGQLK